MPDLRKYWEEIRAIEKTLSDFVWLMSLDNPSRGQVGGSIAEVSGNTAAKLLHARSHRLATDDEIGAHQMRQQEAKRDALHDRLRRQGVSVVPVHQATKK